MGQSKVREIMGTSLGKSGCCGSNSSEGNAPSALANSKPGGYAAKIWTEEENMSASGLAMKYPMWVVPVRAVLGMTDVRPHQDLMEEGLLLEATPEMEILFASHQWTGFGHPDAGFGQFKKFQECLSGLIDGSVTIRLCALTVELFGKTSPTSLNSPEKLRNLLDAYVWYDYFSVPQIKARSIHQNVGSELQKAVDSIPAYVARCNHFFAVCPTTPHVDLQDHACDLSTWSSRGWCRAELAARMLSLRDDPVINIQTGKFCYEAMPYSWVLQPPHLGNFAVDTDRPNVNALVGAALEAKIGRNWKRSKDPAVPAEEQEEARFTARFLSADRVNLDRSEPQLPEDGPLLPAWLDSLGLKSPQDKGANGWTAMHFAAVQGHVAVLRELAKADPSLVEAHTAKSELDYWAFGGVTPLMCALMFITVPARMLEVVKVLLEELKADPRARVGETGASVLHMACQGLGGPEVVGYLLDRPGGASADLEAETTAPMVFAGQTPIFTTAVMNRPEVCRLLLERGANLHKEDTTTGQTAMHKACLCGSKETLEVLLGAGADPNHLTSMSMAAGAGWQDAWADQCPVMWPPGRQLPGGTPLHMAVLCCREAIAETLLAAGAKPRLANEYGDTALSLARKFGAENAVECFMEPRQ